MSVPPRVSCRTNFLYPSEMSAPEFGRLLPRLVSDACLEAVSVFGFPEKLPLHCALTAVILSSQGNVNAPRPGGGEMPVSRLLIYADEASTGKSTAFEQFMKGAKEVEEEFAPSPVAANEHRLRLKSWEDLHRQVLRELERARAARDTARIREALEQRARSRTTYPAPPRQLRFITNDTTVGGLLNMNAISSSFVVATTEGATVFAGELMRKTGHLNLVLDGETVNWDRASGLRKMRDARISLSVMAHPSTVEEFISSKGEIVFRNGFMDRADILSPSGLAQGFRPLTGLAPHLPHLDAFRRRLRERLLHCRTAKLANTFARSEPRLSAAGEQLWLSYCEEIRMWTAPTAPFHEIASAARKSPDKALRYAAAFHDFEECPGEEISVDTMAIALRLSAYLLHEWRRLLGPRPETSVDQALGRLLLVSLIRMIQRGEPALLPKSWLAPRVPAELRRQPNLDIALAFLASYGLLHLEQWPGGRKSHRMVRLNVAAIMSHAMLPGGNANP